MITHDFTYKFYLFRNRNPFIDINLIPFSKDCSSFSSLIGETAYRKNKTILDEIIDNVKHLLDGKIDYYDFGEEWVFADCTKDETEISDLDGFICIISTQKLYKMLLEWRVYFRENFDESMEGLCE